MRGDSQCVIRWLTGRYRCHNTLYANTVHDMQNRLYELCVRYNLQSPESGRDIWKWIYREGNEAADLETHLAREQKVTSDVRWDHDILNLLFDCYRVLAVRGSFDGGKCEEGVSCGWVIDLCMSRDPPLSSSSSPACNESWWQLGVGRRAFMLPPHCTITQAELAAADSLLAGFSELATWAF